MSMSIDQSAPVRQGEELAQPALASYLRHALPAAGLDAAALQGDLVVEQFPSGYSNLTYLLRLGSTELVLRRPPFAVQVESGHDMEREFRVLSGLAPVYRPAPRPYVYCDDTSVIGAPFYVMERRRGVIVRRDLPQAIAGDAALFTRMCEALVDTLAQLHSVDVAAAELGDLGRPEGYVRRQVEGWIKRFERAKTSEVPEMEALGRWLLDHMPQRSEATLVHNDFKFDNVMLEPDDPTRVIAVLDWELCTQGDPLMDLGTTLGYWVQEDDDPLFKAMAFSPTTAPGAMSRRQVAQRYAERTGRDISNIHYYYCFGLLKIAVIGQQIFYRFKHGHTQDPRFATLDKVVHSVAKTGARAAEQGTY